MLGNDNYEFKKLYNKELKDMNFTAQGEIQFIKTVEDYSESLFIKSKSYSNLEENDGVTKEITGENVRNASRYISTIKSIEKDYGFFFYLLFIVEKISIGFLGISIALIKDGIWIYVFAISMLIWAIVTVMLTKNRGVKI